MSPEMIAIAVLVLVILVLIYVMWTNKGAAYESMIAGLWEGDENFLKQSELTSMIVYIGPNIGGVFSELRRAYIIMTTAATVIMQKVVYLTLDGSAGIFGSNVSKTLSLADDEHGNVESGDPKPGLDTSDDVSVGKVITDVPMSCNISFSIGCMVWENDEKIYARLFRNYRDDTPADMPFSQDVESNADRLDA